MQGKPRLHEADQGRSGPGTKLKDVGQTGMLFMGQSCLERGGPWTAISGYGGSWTQLSPHAELQLTPGQENGQEDFEQC